MVMGLRVYRSKPLSLLAALLFITLGNAATGDDVRLAISGYDPVAYFTDGKPTPGNPQYEYVWHDARWRFANASHRVQFIQDPDQFAPQFDGYCAMGLAMDQGHKSNPNPEAWAIIDGKLYVMHSLAGREGWLQNVAENVERDKKNWPTVKEQPEPTD
jgi:hypothetical protein